MEKTTFLELDSFEGMAEMIKSLESGMYSGINEKNEKIVIMREVGCGATLKTFQNNGWIRCNDYDEQGFMECESFEGRWNKGDE